MQRDARKLTQPEGLTIAEQLVELRPVALEFRPGIEEFAEDILHPDNLRA